MQGGGCTTVGVAGLVQSGGFGSFSKHYGTAAAGLLEAEVVTADGKIRIANACNDPDLFFALKGGGGGSFGVVSKLTLRVRELPEWFGAAIITIKAASDDAYRRLVRQFLSFYREQLFNDHWGEQIHVQGDNALEIRMVSHGLDGAESKRIWQPFLDWLSHAPQDYTLDGPHRSSPAFPARHWWDVEFHEQAASRSLLARPASRRQSHRCLVGRAMAGRPVKCFTATSRYGCRRRCWIADRRTRWPTPSSSARATGMSSCTSTRVSPALPPTPSPPPATRHQSRRARCLRARHHRRRNEPAIPGVPGHEPDFNRARVRCRANASRR